MDDRSRHGWRQAFAAAAWALVATLPILVAVTARSEATVVAGAWSLGLVGSWLWREREAGRPLLDATGLAALAISPALLLAWNGYLDRWPGPHGLHLGSPWVAVPAHATAAAMVSAALVRAVGRRDGALSIAGAVIAPAALVPWAFARAAERGPTRLVVALLLLAAVTLALAISALRRRWKLGALPVVGLAALVLLPALALGVHEHAYNLEDWPCSSMNFHLRVHPWLRMIAHATSLGLVVAAGGEILRRRAWLPAATLVIGAWVVQVPASYVAYRSGCGGEIGQGVLGWTRQEDPGCLGGCYCGVTYDGLGRPELLRADDAPLQLAVPVWLLDGSRADVRFFLLGRQEAMPLPIERCRR